VHPIICTASSCDDSVSILGHVMWSLLWRNGSFFLNFTFTYVFLSSTENVTYWLGLLYYLANFLLFIETEFQRFSCYLPLPPLFRSPRFSAYIQTEKCQGLTKSQYNFSNSLLVSSPCCSIYRFLSSYRTLLLKPLNVKSIVSMFKLSLLSTMRHFLTSIKVGVQTVKCVSVRHWPSLHLEPAEFRTKLHKSFGIANSMWYVIWNNSFHWYCSVQSRFQATAR
jgi:hypothetical protein